MVPEHAGHLRREYGGHVLRALAGRQRVAGDPGRVHDPVQRAVSRDEPPDVVLAGHVGALDDDVGTGAGQRGDPLRSKGTRFRAAGEDHLLQLRQALRLGGAKVDRLEIEEAVADRNHQQVALKHRRAGLVEQCEVA